MDKKILISLLFAVIAMVVVVNYNQPPEEGPDSEVEDQFEDDRNEERLWNVGDKLFYSYDLIDELDYLDEENQHELRNKYDQLEEDLWTLEGDYYDELIDGDEFREEIDRIEEEIDDFIQELEDL